MKFNLFVQKSSNLHMENKLLKFVVLAIGCITLVNTVMIQKAVTYQRVVLIPPGLDSKVEVTGDQLSEEYIKTMVRYATQLALTYSPATARKQFDTLLTMFTPEAYPQAQQLFYDLAGTIETANVSSVFYLDSKLLVDTKAKTIELYGQNKKFKENTLVSDAVTKYELDYVVRNGKFELTKITQKDSKDRERGK